MYQKVINTFYRNPRSKMREIKRFGGYLSYFKLQQSKKQMIEKSSNLPSMQSFESGLPLYFLTGKKYLYQTLFCIRSLFKISQEKFCIYLIDDGSFDEELINQVKKQLPGAIVVDAETIAKNLDSKLPLEEYPAIRNKRKIYPHLKKLTDIHTLFNQDQWKLVLDSDMLFWSNPKQMIDWLKTPKKPLYMLDSQRSYGYSIELMESLCKNQVPDLVNVGLIGLESQAINWNKVEKWIVQLEQAEGTSYYLEQALSAMLINSKSSLILPKKDYIVYPSSEEISNNQGILHHYVDLSKKDYFNTEWKKILI